MEAGRDAGRVERGMGPPRLATGGCGVREPELNGPAAEAGL